MNNDSLSHFANALNEFFPLARAYLNTATENEHSFGLTMNGISTVLLHPLLVRLSPFANDISITIFGSVQQARFRYSVLCEQAIRCIEWVEDEDITPQDLSESAAQIFLIFKQEYPNGATASNVRFIELLSDFHQLGGEIDLSVSFQIDKDSILEKLNFPNDIRAVLYVQTEKFEQSIRDKYFWDLENYWGEKMPQRCLVLLADATGFASSAWLKIVGRNNWEDNEIFNVSQDMYVDVLADALKFRKNEVHWEFKYTSLSPFSFIIQQSNLDKPELIQILNNLCIQASLCFLSDHSYLENGFLVCEFTYQKKTKINIKTSLSLSNDTANIYNLFQWSYENSKSDKINIVRQIISISLSDDPEKNYLLFLAKAFDILKASKNNFQFYLRTNVEKYFSTRQSAIEFLQKFSKDTNEAVSKITSDLVSDLYKVIGIVIADVIAILIDPHYFPIVIHWTALLYCAYICLTLVYSLSFRYISYLYSIKTLSINLGELSKILTFEELSELKKEQYNNPRFTFIAYFVVSSIIYSVLGGIAFQIAGLTR